MNATSQRGRVEVSRPRFLREVPGFLNALRIALTVCRETPRAELLATANAPAGERTYVQAHDLVGLCRCWQSEAV